jgi:diguanylate cyclase (GGDEF)-like protein/PAS domain S-box-containing protein
MLVVMKSIEPPMAGYALWFAVLGAAYFALPGMEPAIASLAGLSAAAAVLVGLARDSTARRLPWLLVAGAALSFAASQLILQALPSGQLPPPSLSAYDALAVAKYPLLAGGLALFARSRSVGGDRRSLIDAVTVTAAFVMLIWIFRILPNLLQPVVPGEQRAVSIAYPIGQAILLLALARLLAPGTAWSRGIRLVGGGTAFALVASAIFGLLRVDAELPVPRLVELGWMACFALCGAAAIHPAMRELTEPARRRRAETSRVRLVFLMAIALVAPALLIYHGDTRGAGIAASSMVLYVIALTWIWTVDILDLRGLTWERALHAAGPALASARSVDEIATALQNAGDAGFGPRSGRAMVFAARFDDDLRVLMTADGGKRPSCLAAKAGAWLPSVRHLLSGCREAGGRDPVYVPAAVLASAAGLKDCGPGYGQVVAWPLIAGDGWRPDPVCGVLAVIGPRWSLENGWPSLEILAREAGLAMERVLLTQELVKQEGQEVFQTLVRDASDAILIINDGGIVRYATHSATDIFGDIPIEGNDVRELTYESERLCTRTNPDTAPRARGGARDFDELWRLKRHDGRTVLVWARLSDLRADPTVEGRVLTLRDVTEQRRLQDELWRNAFYDSLTGLANRLLFTDRVDHALAMARRTGTAASVLFLDLDDFKEVNDTLGHNVGDELLAEVGRRLAVVAREADTAARMGGDEFALLIENLGDPADADALADRVVAAFSRPFMLSSGEVIMTATVGVATSLDSDARDGLMRHADLALYAAKSAGKRRWQRYSPALSTDRQRRIEIRSALEKAIPAEQFTLAYQPVVALQTGMVTGLEALIRWPHPQWGLMLPGQFIEVAEETGLIIPIGTWVLEHALADMAALRRSGASWPYVAVNVSARQFRAGGVATLVKNALESSGLPPSALLLELTESALLRPDAAVARELAEIKATGVRLAIDDFGTGYSSLGYLREMPIDVVKIDRTFVDGIEGSQQRLALVQGIVQIAHTLEMSVIAEGIETAEQYQLLAEMGCDYGQGYLLAKPADYRLAEAVLRSGESLSPARL